MECNETEYRLFKDRQKAYEWASLHYKEMFEIPIDSELFCALKSYTGGCSTAINEYNFGKRFT